MRKYGTQIPQKEKVEFESKIGTMSQIIIDTNGNFQIRKYVLRKTTLLYCSSDEVLLNTDISMQYLKFHNNNQLILILPTFNIS